MRVLFLNPGQWAVGGAERSLVPLVSGLTERGHTVQVVVPAEGGAADVFARAGARVTIAQVGMDAVPRHEPGISFAVAMGRQLPALSKKAREVRKIARATGADIIHSNGFQTHVLAPLLRSSSWSVVWSLRDWAPRAVQRAGLDLLAETTGAVICNSEFTASQLHLSRRRARVVPNPVTIGDLPSREHARVTLGIPLDRPVVAMLAHLHRSKGHDQLLRAMGMIEPSARPLTVIAGGDTYGEASRNYRRELGSQVVASGLQDDVILLGAVERTELVLAASDVVVHPARHPEGFGRVIVEAQLAGRPIVATALGGVRETIRDGVSGLLVPPGDAVALQAALRRVLSDPALQRRLIAGGDASAINFGAAPHVDAVEAIYSSLRAGRRSSSEIST